MAIAVDNTSNGTDANSSQLTVAHTVTSIAGGGILVVTIQVTDSSDTDRVISTVTHNGEACTHLLGADADDAIEQRTEIWYRNNPTTGGTPNIVVTPDGTCTDLTLGAISLTGVRGELIGVIDSYSASNYSHNMDLYAGGTNRVGQSFTGDGRLLDNATYYIGKDGSPTGSIYAKIYNHTGTYGTSSEPTGAAIATSDAFDSSTLDVAQELENFLFTGADRVVLTDGAKYVLVLEADVGDAGNSVTPGLDQLSPTHGGNASTSSDGSSWTPDSATDCIFYINTSPPAQSAKHPNTGPPTLSITTVGTSSYVIDSLAIAESDGTKIGVVHDSIHKTDVGGDTHASQYVDAGGAGAQTMNYTDTDSDKSWVLSAVAVQIAGDGTPAPSVSDDLTVTDSVTLDVSDPQVDVTDNVTVTDSDTVAVGGLPDANASAQDDLTITDSALLDILIAISSQDALTVSDSATLDVSDPQIDVQDDATVTDSATVDVQIGITAQDDATITDSATLDIPVNASVQDDLTITDSALAAVSDPQIAVQDDVTVTDVASATVSDPQVIAQDDVAITDSATVALGAVGVTEVVAQDDLTVTDSATAGIQIEVSAFDNATIADSATASVQDATPRAPSVQDDAIVTDSASLVVSDPQVSVSDNLTVADVDTVTVEALAGPREIDVTDNLTVRSYLYQYESGIAVADSATVDTGAAPDPAPSVQDDVTITDSATLAVSDPQVIAQDNLTVTDSATATIQEATTRTIAAQDDITVTDSATVDDKPPWYNTDTLTINTGSITAGAIEDTWTDNAARLQLAEMAGTPGFQYDFDFYDVPSSVRQIAFNGYYEGNPAHNVKIKQWNFTGSSWTDLTSDANDFPSGAADYSLTFRVFHGADFISSGNLRLQIEHESAGNINHDLYIDHFQLGTDPAVHINENIIITDSATSAVSDPQVSAQDDLTVTDSATVSITRQVSVQDDLTVTDSDTVVLGDAGITEAVAQDDLTVTDSATATVSDPQVIVQDNLTVTDADTVALGAVGITEAIASDNLTVTDSASAVVSTPLVSVSDNVEIADSANLAVSDPGVSVQDDVTITDSANAAIQDATARGVVVQDDVEVTDSATLDVSDPQISVQDDIAVTDADTVALGAAGVAEINVSDDLTVSDVATADVSDPQVSVQDDVTVTDSATAAVGAVGVAEINVSDDLTVSDSASADVSDPAATVQDDATIADSATVSLSTEAVVSDNLTVADSTTVIVSTLNITAADNLTVADSDTVSIGAPGVLSVVVQDDLTLTDTNSQIVVSFISISDNVTVADSVTTTLPDALVIYTSDAITVSESFYGGIEGQEDVSASDSVGVTDSASVYVVLTLLDVGLTDAAVAGATLADALFAGASLSDAAVFNAALSDVSRA